MEKTGNNMIRFSQLLKDLDLQNMIGMKFLNQNIVFWPLKLFFNRVQIKCIRTYILLMRPNNCSVQNFYLFEVTYILQFFKNPEI